MLSGTPKRVGIYARLSLSTDESVSIDRQVQSARAYAKARGWEVVVIAIDDGVSATAYSPDRRPGWQELLSHDLDIVLVWKIDRLARRVLDFLQAHKVLDERGAAIVAIEDPIDMTSTPGRAFATMLAVFAEMEASATSARVKASNAHRVKLHMARGGPVIWTHRNVKEDGVLVTRPTPEGREGVHRAIEILRDGGTLAQVSRAWREITGKAYDTKTVRLTLTNPMLAGGTRYLNKILRDDDGVMMIDPDRAILSTSDWMELCEAVSGRAKKRTRYAEAPALLDGLLLCGTCGGTMGKVRATEKGQARYKCHWRTLSTGARPTRACTKAVSVALSNADEFVSSYLLEVHGNEQSPARIAGSQDAIDRSATLKASLAELDAALGETDDEEEGITLLRQRKALREQLKAAEMARATVLIEPEGTIAERWAGADLAERRAILRDTFHAILCAPSRTTRGVPPNERLHLIYDEEDPLLRDFAA